jgi:hypothetical protein
LQVGKAAPERRKAFVSTPGQIESVAHIDGPVFAGEVKGVHGLLVQARLEALARRLVAAMAQHIARNVAAVDVHTGAQQRQEQAPHAAAQIQRGLAEPGDYS